MKKLSFKDFAESVKNDVKIAVDDVFAILEKMSDDVELLKVKTAKPDKHSATLLLDYLGWEEGKPKANLEKICGEELEMYMKWLDYYCKKDGTIREQVLKEIINGEI